MLTTRRPTGLDRARSLLVAVLEDDDAPPSHWQVASEAFVALDAGQSSYPPVTSTGQRGVRLEDVLEELDTAVDEAASAADAARIAAAAQALRTPPPGP